MTGDLAPRPDADAGGRPVLGHRPSQPLADRIRRRIREAGPIPFAAFMEAALYDPDEGFYARPPVGERGAYVTAPHVAPAFGDLLTRQLLRMRDALGATQPFHVIELGAGDGTLARQVLSAMPEDVARSVRYLAVERSPGAREQLTRLAATHGTAATLEVTDRLGDLPPVTGCVLANELLDNLPFHRLRGTGDGAEELYVTLDGDAFVLTPGPLSPDLRRAIGDLEGPDVRVQLPAGQESVVSPAALAFVDAAVRTLDRGYVVLIDYAAEGDQPAGIVHGYRRHRVEEDVLSAPGTRDITAGVDFGAVAHRAVRAGCRVWGPTTQRDLLLNLGFRVWDAAWLERQVEAAAERRGIESMRIYSMRSRATLLIDPAALGSFQVLCAGVGDVPEPTEMRERTRRAGPARW